MRYKLLGKSGLRVSEFCLGTMTFGEEWGWGASKEQSRQIFDVFVNAGGNFIDTANHYTNGTSELYLGDFTAGQRERLVIATKYTLNPRPEDPNGGGNHRKNMVQSLEASLQRLNTDYIDLYWLHAWDFVTPVEEVMRALDDMIRAGKILYIGISDTPAWIISRANMLAELRGWSAFVGLQIQYSLVERTAERELLPMAKTLDIAVTAWGALGAGVLTGKYNPGKERSAHSRGEWGDRSLTRQNLAIAETVESISQEIGCSPAQVALSWIRRQPYGVMIPILGATKVSQLEDNLASVNVELTASHCEQLDELSGIELGFPHDFLNLDDVKQVIYGNTLAKLDIHR
jgi:aryl-alcohol dehydrogenase-like predicted oxidoreductase